MSAEKTLRNVKNPLALFSRIFIEKEVTPLTDYYAGLKAEHAARER